MAGLSFNNINRIKSANNFDGDWMNVVWVCTVPHCTLSLYLLMCSTVRTECETNETSTNLVQQCLASVAAMQKISQSSDGHIQFSRFLRFISSCRVSSSFSMQKKRIYLLFLSRLFSSLHVRLVLSEIRKQNFRFFFRWGTSQHLLLVFFVIKSPEPWTLVPTFRQLNAFN